MTLIRDALVGLNGQRGDLLCGSVSNKNELSLENIFAALMQNQQTMTVETDRTQKRYSRNTDAKTGRGEINPSQLHC